MVHLQSVERRAQQWPHRAFPFTVPAIAGLDRIEFRHPVTFFVGENGSGKSTLMEAIAASIGLPAVGGDADLRRAADMEPARRLADALRLGWSRKIRRGLFLRAEDFFNFARRTRTLIEELRAQGAEYERALEERPFAEGLFYAMGSARGQARELAERYGEDLNAVSHGESFLQLFGARVVPQGLYLLDEPEAPLSPLRQLGFLSLLKQRVEEGCQFLIATHSPLLMAFPEAAILSFDDPPIREVRYEELEHVTLTRAFLMDPSAFLRRL